MRKGRPRDPSIEPNVLAVVREHLASHGYAGLSMVAVAEQAGTTRQAMYRRWSSKADLATAAIAGMSAATRRPESDDPFVDLVDELTAFRDAVMQPNGIGLVGSMLQDATEIELRDLFRDRVVRPRRAHIRQILDRAVAAGLVDTQGDVDLAVASCTGTLYAIYLESGSISAGWPTRAARHAWRSLGGTPPSG